MSFSIRNFLLINLLTALGITTSLAVLGNYYLDQRDIDRHLDTLMVITAISHQALLGPNLDAEHLQTIQQSLNDLNLELDDYYRNRHISQREKNYARKFNFQIWDINGKLLLRSPNAPKQPLSNTHEGFTDESVNQEQWRVFTAYDPGSQTYTMIGESYKTRHDLGLSIAADDLYIMLLTFPLSGALIWIIIGRGLGSLNTIAEEVSKQSQRQLRPVRVDNIPREISPIIEALDELFKKLNDAFEREKRFAQNAAHELRTPLAIMKTHAQVALRVDDVTQRRAALNDLIRGVDRSSHIIKQLLTISRLMPEMNSLNNKEKANLNKCATETVQQLYQNALDKKIDIELIDNEKKPVLVYGNNIVISILIRNLLDNAIRYSYESGRIEIIIEKFSEITTLIIQDNGPGLSKTLRKRVFERFYRVLGNKASGSGLGLTIVAQICDSLYAQISVLDGIDGKGLAFKIIFKNNPFEKNDLNHNTKLYPVKPNS